MRKLLIKIKCTFGKHEFGEKLPLKGLIRWPMLYGSSDYKDWFWNFGYNQAIRECIHCRDIKNAGLWTGG